MHASDQRCRTAPASSRMRNNINWIKKYSCKFKDMHTRLGLNNQDQILPITTVKIRYCRRMIERKCVLMIYENTKCLK